MGHLFCPRSTMLVSTTPPTYHHPPKERWLLSFSQFVSWPPPRRISKLFPSVQFSTFQRIFTQVTFAACLEGKKEINATQERSDQQAEVNHVVDQRRLRVRKSFASHPSAFSQFPSHPQRIPPSTANWSWPITWKYFWSPLLKVPVGILNGHSSFLHFVRNDSLIQTFNFDLSEFHYYIPNFQLRTTTLEEGNWTVQQNYPATFQQITLHWSVVAEVTTSVLEPLAVVMDRNAASALPSEQGASPTHQTSKDLPIMWSILSITGQSRTLEKTHSVILLRYNFGFFFKK